MDVEMIGGEVEPHGNRWTESLRMSETERGRLHHENLGARIGDRFHKWSLCVAARDRRHA